MRTDDHGASHRDLVEGRDDPDALGVKASHQMAVVGDGAEGHGGFPGGNGLLHQIHGTVDAVAKAGGLCKVDIHCVSPRL